MGLEIAELFILCAQPQAYQSPINKMYTMMIVLRLPKSDSLIRGATKPGQVASSKECYMDQQMGDCPHPPGSSGQSN